MNLISIIIYSEYWCVYFQLAKILFNIDLCKGREGPFLFPKVQNNRFIEKSKYRELTVDRVDIYHNRVFDFTDSAKIPLNIDLCKETQEAR